MAFITVSDGSGEMEAVAFPNVFKKYQTLLGQGNFVLIEGKVEEREGKGQFIIQQVFDLEEWIKTKPIRQQPVLYLKISAEQPNEKILNSINNILAEHKGAASVILHDEATRKTVKLGSEKQVHPTFELQQKLRNLLGEKNVVLRD